MNRFALTIIPLLISACGGGGDPGTSDPGSSDPGTSDAAPPIEHIADGTYDIRIDEQAGALNGFLVSSGDAFVYASKAQMGFGTWVYAPDQAMTTMTTLVRPIDDFNIEFPSAKSAGMTRAMTLIRAAGGWFANGTGNEIELVPARNASAPAISSIPRNWHFRNLYEFGGLFLHYEVQIDIDTNGVLTGFDTNGCAFHGNLVQSGALYSVDISTSLCGATNDYIENDTYRGHGFMANDQLHLYTVNADHSVGLALDLFSGPGASPEATRALAIAMTYLGTPYKWGGSTPETGFDAAGLIQYAYAQVGIQIPRTTHDQFNSGRPVAAGDPLLPGDLVFFRDPSGDVHHVGMALDSDRFIHAPHTGDVIKISSLSEPYYAAQFAGARRIG
jgi:cell wall-associated NlpC family hydrolase